MCEVLLMPIFEYACDNCKKIFSFLVRNPVSHKPPNCPKCKRGGMKRIISAFRISRRDEDRFEKLADPSALAGLDEKDPRALARWMRKMGKESGEEMPEEMNEICERLEAGESPEEIERSMGETDYTRDDSGKLYEG
jgi:putative FmdB family regulatory protein